VLSRALAALLTLVVCAGSLDFGHAGGDDPEYNPVLVHHDHSAHKFSSAPSQPEPAADHCFICHSLRLLHTTLIARGASVVLSVHSTALWRADGLAASDAIGLARSSRAPPALSL
jgi:hypothetical protein